MSNNNFYDYIPLESVESFEIETEEEKRLREEKERLEAEQRKLKEIQVKENTKQKIELENQKEKVLENTEEKIIPPTKLEKDLYDSIDEDYDKNLDYSKLDDSVSATRQLQYGARQEKTIFGNITQLTTAFFTRQKDETFKEAAQRIERKRQEEILKDYPEFRGKQESLTVISGRMGVAIADPATILVPWVKIAKAGKLANIGVGGAIASSDMALREYTLTGEVTPLNLGLSFGLGGISSGVSSVISDKILKSSRASNVVTEKLDDTTIATLKEAGEETVAESQEAMNTWSKSFNTAGMKYTERDILDTEISKLKDAIKGIVTPLKDPKQKTMPFGLDSSLKPTPTLTITEAQKIKLKKELIDLEKQRYIIQKEIDEINFIEMPEQASIIGFNSLIKLWNKVDDKGNKVLEGKYGESLIRALVQEMVRPTIGAVSGGLIVLGMSDGKNDDALKGAIIAGTISGAFMKRIQNSQFKLSVKTKQVLNEQIQKEFKLHWLTATKQMFAGTQATHFQANNYIMQSFGNSLFRNQGMNIVVGKPIPDAIETLTSASEDFFRKKLYKITGTASDEDVAAATRILQQRNMPSNAKYSFLDEGDLENVTAKKLAEDVLNLQEEFKKYVKQTGVLFEESDSYGLTQIFNKQAADLLGTKETLRILKEAFRIQNINLNKLDPKKYKLITDTSNKKGGKTVDEKLEEIVKNYLNNSDGIRRKEIVSSENLIRGTKSFLDNEGNPLKEKDTLIQSARFFDNERTLFDQEARAYAKDLFIQDFEFTTNSLFENTIPVVEFARKYGSKGQGLDDVISQLKNFYKQKSIKSGGTGDFTLDKGLRELYNRDVKLIAKGVNSLFGVHDISKGVESGNSLSKSFFMTLQALLSTTKLTKVAIPSLGDLIQVFQNSGPKAAMNSLILQMRKSGAEAVKPSAALALRSGRIKEGFFGRKDGDITFGLTEKILQTPFKNRRYNGTLQKELSNFSMTATTKYQDNIVGFQKRFFEIVQLGRITRFAREFAFDAGAIRAFELTKKTKIKQRHLQELTEAGFNKDNIKYLSKFNNIDEAMEDGIGKRLLEMAGRKAADRDALIPTAGNRRLFSQSNNPWMRFAGSFLSWAQAKSSQTNALIGRMENGDAKLATLMLATLPIYASVRQLQVQLHPDEDIREMGTINPLESTEEALKFLGEGGIFSGQFGTWYLDKFLSSIKYNQDSLVETVYPAASLLSDGYKTILKTAQGDSTTKLTLLELGETGIPFAKEITRRPEVGQALGYEESIAEEIEAEAETKGQRPSYATGGLVEGKDDVPYTKENPADRVDPFTGQPYSAQMEELGLDVFQER